MNSTFWWGIGIGTVLSLLASILANLFMPAISKTLGRFSKTYSDRSVKRKAERISQARFYIENHASFIAFIGVNLARIMIGIVFSCIFLIFLLARVFGVLILDIAPAFFAILCLFIVLRSFFEIIDVRAAIGSIDGRDTAVSADYTV